jgi:hypothetical protein
MSDNELKDDWTALVAKEASVLRSGQAWADIFDDDDDDNEDTGVSNEANEQAEGSTTVVNKEHNKMPVDYLDDIGKAGYQVFLFLFLIFFIKAIIYAML